MNAQVKELVTAAPPEVEKAQRQAQTLYEMADAYVVDSQEMYQLAGSELQAIRDRFKAVEAQRVYLKEPFLEGGRRIDAFFRAPLDRLTEAGELLKKRMLTFKKAEDEKAETARKEAERIAAAERKRLDDIRIAAEAQAEEARKAGDETTARAAEETAAVAADAIETADIAPVALPVAEKPHAAGISTRQTWKAEVTDLHALIKGAAAALEKGDPTLAAYLVADTKALGQVAKALKASARIPGVRVYAEEGIAVRS